MDSEACADRKENLHCRLEPNLEQKGEIVAASKLQAMEYTSSLLQDHAVATYQSDGLQFNKNLEYSIGTCVLRPTHAMHTCDLACQAHTNAQTHTRI